MVIKFGQLHIVYKRCPGDTDGRVTPEVVLSLVLHPLSPVRASLLGLRRSPFALGYGFAIRASPSPFAIDSGFALNPRTLRALDAGFALEFHILQNDNNISFGRWRMFPGAGAYVSDFYFYSLE